MENVTPFKIGKNDNNAEKQNQMDEEAVIPNIIKKSYKTSNIDKL